MRKGEVSVCPRAVLQTAAAYPLSAPLSKTNPASAIRAYILTGLTNYAWYTVTLPAGDGG